MFRKNTVFVVGAGASAELGLPVGAQLTDLISSDAALAFTRAGIPFNDQSAFLMPLLHDRAQALGDESLLDLWLEALEDISEGVRLKWSIDAFIDQHADRPEIAGMGKLLIAKNISEAERSSFLAAPSGKWLTSPEVSSSWLDIFARMLFDGLKRTEVDRIGEGVAIVCFNYDRCIERYLGRAISQTYRMNIAEGAALASTIEIIHPYGSLGRIEGWPPETSEQDARMVPFGATDANLWTMSEGLRTFGESRQRGTERKIQSVMEAADQFVYLGFSFQRQNMHLLEVPYSSRERHSYASAFSESAQSRNAIAKAIAGATGDQPEFDVGGPLFQHVELGMTARALLQNHWHNIMGS